MRQRRRDRLHRLVASALMVVGVLIGLLPAASVSGQAVTTATPVTVATETVLANPTPASATSTFAIVATATASVTASTASSPTPTVPPTRAATPIPVASSTTAPSSTATATYPLPRTATATMTVALPTANVPTATVPVAPIHMSSASVGARVASTVVGYPFTSLVAGGSHSCGLTGEGKAYCWGDNSAGQLGDGTTGTSRTTPVAVRGSVVFASLAAGAAHTCGLTADGAAYCWGGNDSGQLGIRTSGTSLQDRSADTNTPTAVTGGITFRSLVAGAYHTCGLTSSWTTACWGLNASGQLLPHTWGNQSSPIEEAGLRFSRLVAGNSHTCGLEVGGAYCWGAHPAGSTPQLVGGAYSFANITSGASHACGLTASGVAYCWGNNASGQIGDGTTSSVTAPVAVSGSQSFSVLSAGGSFTCGIVLGGNVSIDNQKTVTYCWGSNRYGQIGDGGPADGTASADRLTPVFIRRNLFRSLATGGDHACGLNTTGVAYCWGRNDKGQLGDGTTANRSTPTTVNVSAIPVVVPTPTVEKAAFTSLAAGGYHTCGLTASGTAYCWGANSSGELGDGTITNRASPVAVTGGKSFTSIVAGARHTCGLTSAGAAYCWGFNAYGQIGDGTAGGGDAQGNGSHTADRLSPVAVGGGKTFASLAAGGYNTCGLTSAGVAYCWGNNYFGQIGDGTTGTAIGDDSANRLTPTAVSGNLEFAALTVGLAHACGRTAMGKAYCWGNNLYGGQIGDGTSSSNRLSPVAVSGNHSLASLNAGYTHTCGVESGGVLWCWGRNVSGELGDGSTSNQSAPVKIGVETPIIRVAAGTTYTCGLTPSSIAYCWGDNAFGQIGDGSVTGHLSPVAVAGSKTFTDIVAGWYHTCGLTTTRVAYCWGANGVGQIGDGTSGASEFEHGVDRLVPYAVDVSAVVVPTATPTSTATMPMPAFIKVAAGADFTCGLSSNGSAYCWGSNSQGQLGDGNAGIQPVGPSPVAVKGGLSFVSLFAGGSSACGLTANGQAYCWGRNTIGSLGNGTTANSSAPVAVSGDQKFTRLAVGPTFTCGISSDGSAYCWGGNLLPGYPATPRVVPGGLVLKDIVAGSNHVCGLTVAGATYCWGRNSYGSLGDGSSGWGSETPVLVQGGYKFTSLGNGYDHTCGLTANGSAYCWGDNASGQIGDGTSGAWRDDHSIIRTTPVAVLGGHAFVQLGGGFQHTCGLTASGASYCWGYNSSAQLGDGSTTNHAFPTATNDSHAFTALSVGEGHVCALNVDGSVWCWGRDASGQLGDGGSGGQSVPIKVSGTRAFADISAGTGDGAHTCAIKLSGEPYCWGYGGDGRIGDGNVGINRATPVPVVGGLKFAHVTTGSGHSCGLTEAGVAWCWGSNWYGSVGDGTTGNGSQSADRKVPVLVAGNVTFTSLTAGSARTCGLSSAGSAYCWGGNWNGGVGDGTKEDKPSPVLVTGGKTFVTITVGGSHTCGLTPASTTFCWGRNAEGQFGTGTTPYETTSPTLSAPGYEFASLSAGGAHTCGLTALGRAYCWGANWAGQLGVGTTTNLAQPTAVNGNIVFSTVYSGVFHTCGLTTDGRAFCWGANSSGQLGDGTFESRSTPVAVVGDLVFSQLSVGGGHTCGLVRTSGLAYCWGDRNLGALGDGAFGYQSSPVRAGQEATAPPAIRSIRVANVRDTTFTVSWVTDVPATGTIQWGLDSGTIPATIAPDKRGATGTFTTHFVTVSGLTPATRYRFDVVSGPTTDTNGGAHFLVTTGPTLSPVPSPDQSRGTVSRRDGTAPDGVIVHLVASGPSGTSAPLAALVTTSDAREWAANLGNLRTASLDAAFPLTDATIVAVTSDGGADGTAGVGTTVAIARTGTLALTLGDQSDVPLATGWNLVALRVTPSPTVTASGACALTNARASGAIVEIVRWTAGSWESHRCGFPPNDFTLEAGAGYFVRTTAPAIWPTWGTAVTTAVSRTLGPGWNLVGASATSSAPTTAPSACTALNSTQAGSAIEVVRWVDSGWEAHTCGSQPNAFTLQAGQGYFVRMTRAETWTPVGSAP